MCAVRIRPATLAKSSQRKSSHSVSTTSTSAPSHTEYGSSTTSMPWSSAASGSRTPGSYAFTRARHADPRRVLRQPAVAGRCDALRLQRRRLLDLLDLLLREQPPALVHLGGARDAEPVRIDGRLRRAADALRRHDPDIAEQPQH